MRSSAWALTVWRLACHCGGGPIPPLTVAGRDRPCGGRPAAPAPHQGLYLKDYRRRGRRGEQEEGSRAWLSQLVRQSVFIASATSCWLMTIIKYSHFVRPCSSLYIHHRGKTWMPNSTGQATGSKLDPTLPKCRRCQRLLVVRRQFQQL